MNKYKNITQVIHGVCPSKSNMYRFSPNGSMYKTKALTDYERSFYLQCNQYRNAGIPGLFELHLKVFYPANRADLDNSLKIVLDCLQAVKAIPNDNKCVKIIAEKYVDKEKPRIEFEIREI